MCASSDFETHGCWAGFPNQSSQGITQRSPSPPVTRNAARQPKCSVRMGTDSAATMTPTLEPLLNIPVANDLSFWGNQSATVRMAVGKFAASPAPSAKRATLNDQNPEARAWEADARLHTMTAIVYPRRVPMRSMTLPAIG